ncbi:MAG: FAD-binding oxidoreductase [Oligoflexia bacterium]|nr:FAD-binding oxidoreductase [Oligoflexia bacterium]
MSNLKQFPYWLEVPSLEGETQIPRRIDCSIAIIGSGLSGVSVGYWLQKRGFENILIIDHAPNEAATFRNCGHILYGTVESPLAFSSIHGETKAQNLWGYSIDLCHEVRSTILEEGLDCDYRQDGYLVISIDETEDRECLQSVEIINRWGFQSEYVSPAQVKELGFKNAFGARFEKGSAQAHPTKFRNELMKRFLNRGGKYISGVKINGISDTGSGVELLSDKTSIHCDASVIAANAYSPLFSEFFRERRLIEPFRGQIITSRPLSHRFKVTHPHSFDHGYEYALITKDNRLMIGGWRNNSPTKEVGTYDLTPNRMITEGLQEFVKNHYSISEPITWEFEWTGIMGASLTSLPFIGPTSSDRVFSCAGYTGHGFSWAHGSAKLLADIMAGHDLPDVTKYFNPRAGAIK